jgi:S1-C subfamily serine protease
VKAILNAISHIMLFIVNGSFIGVNTAIFSPNGTSISIGFAIPSNTIKSLAVIALSKPLKVCFET